MTKKAEFPSTMVRVLVKTHDEIKNKATSMNITMMECVALAVRQMEQP